MLLGLCYERNIWRQRSLLKYSAICWKKKSIKKEEKKPENSAEWLIGDQKILFILHED